MAIMEGMAFAMTVFGDKPTACIHEKVLLRQTPPRLQRPIAKHACFAASTCSHATHGDFLLTR